VSRGRPGGRALARARGLVLPAMAGALAVYVLLHSPMRDLIAATLGLNSRVCYFVCGDALTTPRVADAASAWVLIVLALVAGVFVTDRIALTSYERPLALGLVMLGLITGPSAAVAVVAGWTGTALLQPPWGPLMAALPAAIIVGISRWRGWRPGWPRWGMPVGSSLVTWVWGLATALLLASAALSVLHPPSGYDALGYHAPLGVFLWREGNASTFVDRSLALAMPGTIQLWYGLLGIAGGESLADLGQLPLALLGAASIVAFTRRLGLRSSGAQLAGGAFLLAPMVLSQVGVQLADVAGAGLFMATVALAAGPIEDWTGRRVGLLGLGLGLVLTTKLALLPCVAVLVVVIVARAWRRTPTPQLAPAVLLFLAISAPWGIRNAVHFGNPLYPVALPVLGRGAVLSDPDSPIDRELVPRASLWPLYPLLERYSDRSGLGALFLLGVVGGGLLATRRARRQPLLIYAAIAAVMLPAWWTLTNHEPRFLLPVFGLGFAFLPYALLATPRRARSLAGAVLAAAAGFSALVTADQVLRPLARQPTGRWEFYDQVWGLDSVVAAMPEGQGILLHTGYANLTYPTYYPLLGASFGRLVIPVDVDTPADSIVARMRRAGVRYAYVAALPASLRLVESLYGPAHFDLVRVSTVEDGWRAGTRRYLFRLKQ